MYNPVRSQDSIMLDVLGKGRKVKLTATIERPISTPTHHMCEGPSTKILSPQKKLYAVHVVYQTGMRSQRHKLKN